MMKMGGSLFSSRLWAQNIHKDSLSTHHSALIQNSYWFQDCLKAISSMTLFKQNSKMFITCKFLIPNTFLQAVICDVPHFINIYLNNHFIIWVWGPTNIEYNSWSCNYRFCPYLGSLTAWFSESNIPKAILNTQWAFNRWSLNELMS